MASNITKPKTYELYTPYKTKLMSDAEINREYSKLRSIANKRLSRLQGQNLGMTARTGYKFPTIKQIEQSNRMDVKSALSEVSRWLRDPRSSVTGEKEFLADFKEMFIEKGYSDLVTSTDQIYRTIQFLEEIRGEYNNKLLPSGDALDALQQAERLKIPQDKLIENIDIFVQHLDELEDIKPTKGGRKFSSQRLNALIRKWK